MSYWVLVIPVTLLVCGLGLSVVLGVYLYVRRTKKGKKSKAARVLDMDCTICHKALVIDRAGLAVPTPT